MTKSLLGQIETRVPLRAKCIDLHLNNAVHFTRVLSLLARSILDEACFDFEVVLLRSCSRVKTGNSYYGVSVGSFHRNPNQIYLAWSETTLKV